MAEILLEHAIAIGAPGTTAWERACLGVPSIIIPLADNQRTIATNLVKTDSAILVEPEQIKAHLTSSYKTLVLNWSKYHLNSLKLCDGLGVKRVSRYIHNLLLGKVAKIILRPASRADVEKVYYWQCQPETRKYALTREKPTWDTHKVWMQNKLESVNDYFYIIQAGDTKESVGVIRLDRIKNAEYLVSIFISPEYFGRGIAKSGLSFIDDIHQHVTLHATVMEDNAASQQLFIAANYKRTSKDNFIRLPII
jgi:RimJ/RimL family protein N-acetyltransferase